MKVPLLQLVYQLIWSLRPSEGSTLVRKVLDQFEVLVMVLKILIQKCSATVQADCCDGLGSSTLEVQEKFELKCAENSLELGWIC